MQLYRVWLSKHSVYLVHSFLRVSDKLKQNYVSFPSHYLHKESSHSNMNWIPWWKSQHTALAPESMDEIDEINAGKHFNIRYLGCTCLDKDEGCDFNKTAGRILNNLSDKTIKKLPVLELLIDSQFLSVSDAFTQNSSLLHISLTDIRDVFYRKRDSHYNRICIFVARYLPFSPRVKAHVVYCENSILAEELYQAINSAFKAFHLKATAKTFRRQVPARKFPIK